MNRPSFRGSSTGGALDVSRVSEDMSLQFPAVNGKVNEDCRLHDESERSPKALRWSLSQAKDENRSFLSPSKAHLRSSDNVNGLRNPSDALISLKSSIQPVGIYPLPSIAGHPNSTLTLSSGQIRNRKGVAISLGTSMMLCFMNVFVLIGVLGSRGPGYTLRLVPTLGLHKSYRRLQLEVPLDPFKGGIFGQGTVRLKELGVCPGSVEDYVPCYNSSLGFGTDLSDGVEYDRHCDLPGRRKACVIQPPEDYRIPLRWPASMESVWSGNMKFNGDQLSLAGTGQKRLIFAEDGLVTLNLEESEKHFQQVADMIGADGGISFNRAPVRTVLDINCGLSSSAGHLFSKDTLTLCLAPYEANGSQVQFALERGLPAMIASLISRQLPFSSFSFDIIHCFECRIDWMWKDGILILELDRILRPGGFFIWTPSLVKSGEALPIGDDQDWKIKEDLASRICWFTLSRKEQTIIWKKATNRTCYSSRGVEASPRICDTLKDRNSTWYPPLRSCIVVPTVDQGIPRQKKKPSQDSAASSVRTSPTGFSNEELSGDSQIWFATVKSYWSLLTPLIFSDHPKRPGEEDPLPPSNIVRNVMDMNAVHGSLNAALLEAGKSVWVMNVVPSSGPDTLSTIYSRGLVGVLHDWCEAFPTYPRTYDLLHAIGLLSQEADRPYGCGLSNLFLEMDRMLRPEGWVILRDKADLIEDARIAAGQMKWESRVIEVEGVTDLQLLVCQKSFSKNQSLKNII